MRRCCGDQDVQYSVQCDSTVQYSVAACEEAQGLCARLLVLCSLVLVLATLPLSLCFVIKVVQVSRSQEPGAGARSRSQEPGGGHLLLTLAGVRESSHIPPGVATVRGSEGAGRVLRHPVSADDIYKYLHIYQYLPISTRVQVCGRVPEDRHEDADVRRAAPGGEQPRCEQQP